MHVNMAYAEKLFICEAISVFSSADINFPKL